MKKSGPWVGGELLKQNNLTMFKITKKIWACLFITSCSKVTTYSDSYRLTSSMLDHYRLLAAKGDLKATIALARHYQLAERSMLNALPWMILSAERGDQVSAGAVKLYLDSQKMRKTHPHY
jgi:hypothetical protein